MNEKSNEKRNISQNPKEVSELQELLRMRSDQLDLGDVNNMLEILAQKKSELEVVSNKNILINLKKFFLNNK